MKFKNATLTLSNEFIGAHFISLEKKTEPSWSELVLLQRHNSPPLCGGSVDDAHLHSKHMRTLHVSCDLQQIGRTEDRCCFFADSLINQERNMGSEPKRSTSQGSWPGHGHESLDIHTEELRSFGWIATKTNHSPCARTSNINIYLFKAKSN